LTLETSMKIKLEVELDTESEQDVQLIEKVVALVDELKEQLNYENEE
jgi:hypothetical protein